MGAIGHVDVFAVQLGAVLKLDPEFHVAASGWLNQRGLAPGDGCGRS